MKVRKSEITTTQESQESQNITKAKSAGTNPRTARTSADSVEMTSVATAKSENAGKQELTSDQRNMVGNIDPENLTALRSGADPRAAIESRRPKREQASSPGSGKLPGGQSAGSGPDLSRYNAPTANAPETLKESIDRLGKRGDELRSAGPNAADQMNVMNLASKHQGGASAYLGKSSIANHDPFFGANPVEPQGPADHHKFHGTPEMIRQGQIDGSYIEWLFNGKPTDKDGNSLDPTQNAVYQMPDGKVVNASDLTQDQKVAAEANKGKKTGDQETDTTIVNQSGQKPDQSWWDRIVNLVTSSGSKANGNSAVKDPGPGGLDGEGTGNYNWKGLDGDSLLPEQLRTRNVIQGTTGKGPGGGEVVNPSPEGTGGGESKWIDDHGAYKARLGYDNSHYLIGQPAGPGEEQGFNGLSGVDPSDPLSGGVSDAEWTGPTRTEEPGNVRTSPTGGDGQLSHLVNNEDEDDRK